MNSRPATGIALNMILTKVFWSCQSGSAPPVLGLQDLGAALWQTCGVRRRLTTAEKSRARRKLRRALRTGPLVTRLDSWRNYRKIWASVARDAEVPPTSVSDQAAFLGAVKGATSEGHVASRFRSNIAIREIYDHVSWDQGTAYLAAIRGRGKDSLLGRLADLSDYGDPAQFFFPRLGRFSPTILRYAKVALDLEFFFPDLAGFSIAEIGVGFGGQAVVLNKFFGTEHFEFYDLPEVNQLAGKTVERLTPAAQALLKDGRRPGASESDLIVSNYAFSELNRGTQDAYLENVVLPTKRGFMVYNELGQREMGGYSAYDIAGKLPGSVVLPEDPATFPGNVAVVWGSEKFG